MIYTDNDCVGCEYCINCGRKEDYHVFECDDCGESIMELFRYDGKELCENCLKKYFENIKIEDIDNLY